MALSSAPLLLQYSKRVVVPRVFTRNLTNFKNWKIPVPWGHISGKWWGDPNAVPLIALHEYRQNASAFDNLIPKLNVPSVLALDLPGHGQSSHFPTGGKITQLEYLVALRFVTLNITHEQVSIMGHGLGSFLGYVFSGGYHQKVENFISIECSRHILTHVSSTRPNGSGEINDRLLEIENAPLAAYSEENLLSMIKNTGAMSDEAAKILSTRAVQRSGEKLIFTNDPRLEIYFSSLFIDNDLFLIADNFLCKMVEIHNSSNDKLVKYKEGEVAGSGNFDLNVQQLARRKGPDVIKNLQEEGRKRLKKSCRRYFLYEVESPDHILLDRSEEIAKIVNGFYSANLEEHRIILP